MEPKGKRKYYIVYGVNTYDGINLNIVRITKSKREAIKCFEWLYNELIYRDYLNDNGEEIFMERNYWLNTADNDKDDIHGNFYYYDDDGDTRYELATVYTNNMNFGYNRQALEREFTNYYETH